MSKILANGSPSLKRLVQLASQIESIDESIEEISGASLQADDAEAKLRACIMERAKEFDNEFGYWAMPGRPTFLPGDFNVETLEGSPRVNAIGLLYWIFGDELVSRITAKLKDRFPTQGLSVKDRAAAIKKHQRDLEKLLEDEEREFCRLEKEGFFVVRRRVSESHSSINPEVVLRVWGEQ